MKATEKKSSLWPCAVFLLCFFGKCIACNADSVHKFLIHHFLNLCLIDKLLNKYQPHLAVAMMGINDMIYGNNTVSQNALNSHTLSKGIEKLRICKLFNFLWLSIERKMDNGKHATAYALKTFPKSVNYYGAQCRLFDNEVLEDNQETQDIRQGIG